MMQKIPFENWKHIKTDPMPEQVWKDEKFLVQIFKKNNGVTRLSVNKISRSENNWEDGIAWDELQEIKAKVGFMNFDAVEIFPRQRDLVNVANMRHLWVLDKKLDFAWRNELPSEVEAKENGL